MSINPEKLSRELLEASLPVIGARAEGLPAADFSRSLSANEEAAFEAIVAAHDPMEVVLPSLEERLSALEGAMLAQLLGGV